MSRLLLVSFSLLLAVLNLVSSPVQAADCPPPFIPQSISDGSSIANDCGGDAAPNPPSNLSGPASSNDGSADLTWTAATGFALSGNYELERSKNNGAWGNLSIVNKNLTSHTVTNLASGNYRFRLRACNIPTGTGTPDCSSYSTSGNVKINDAPVANAGSNQTVNEFSLVNLSGSATDSDGVISTYVWSHSNSYPITLSSYIVEEPTFTAPSVTSNTSYTLTLTVTDSNGATDSDNVVITVNNVNVVPTANAGSDFSVNEELNFTLSGSASDSDGTYETVWQQISGPTATLSNSSSITDLAPTFTAPDVTSQSTMQFRLTVTDNDGAVKTDTVTVTVNFVNKEPTILAIGKQYVNEGGDVSVTADATDPDGGVMTYSWAQDGTQTETIDNPNSATLSFTASEVDATTDLSFTVTASDPDGGTVSTTVVVEVSNLLSAPTVTAQGPASVNEGDLVSLFANSADSNGSVVSHAWASQPGTNVTLTNPNSQTSTYTPSVNADTTHSFEVTVTDNDGQTATSIISIDVNNAPTSIPGNNQTVYELDPVTLSGSGTDVGGTIATYQWVQYSGPTHTLTNANSATATFTANEVVFEQGSDILEFDLTVTDNDGATDTQRITITVLDSALNAAPTVTVPENFDVDENTEAVVLEGAGEDGGNPVTFLWSSMDTPPLPIIDSHLNIANFNAPNVTEDTTYTFRLTVTDDREKQSYDEVDVTVLFVNQLPTIDAIPDTSVNEGSPLTLTANATDPDETAITYEWVQNNNGAPTVAMSGNLTENMSFTAPAVGPNDNVVLEFTVTATDFHGGQDSTTVTVPVNFVNQNPTVSINSFGTFDEGALVNLTAVGTDLDGDTVTYNWTQSGSPTVTITNADQAAMSFTAPDITSDTTLNFTVTVTDVHEGTGSATANVTINFVNQEPTIAAIADQFVDEGGDVSVTANATDPDGGLMTYSWVQDGTQTETINDSNSATLSFTASEVDATTDRTFTVTATDPDGGTVSTSVTVEVSNVLVAPTVTTATPLSANEGEIVSLFADSNDENGDVVSHAWVASPGTNVTLTNPNSQTATYTASVDADTTHTFEVTVTDNDGQTASASVDVNVNNAPTSIPGNNQTVYELDPVTLSGSGTDVGGSIVSYQWIQFSGPTHTLTNANSATASFTANEVDFEQGAETLEFDLTVTDNDGAKDTQRITITVLDSSLNTPPTVTVPADFATDENTPGVALEGSGEDGGNPVTFLWTSVTDETIIINNANSETANFNAPDVLQDTFLTFRLTVTDDRGAQTSDDVIVEVKFINQLPTINSVVAPIANEGTEVTLIATATDPDGTTIDYTWTQTGTPTVVMSGTATDAMSFTAPNVGPDDNTVLNFTVTATDQDEGSVSSSIDVPIIFVNQAPVIGPITSNPVDEGTEVTLNANSSDPDGDALTYSWVQVGTPAVAMSGADTENMSFTAPELTTADSLTLNFTLTTSDTHGDSTEANVSVVVNNVNQAPIIQPIEDQNATAGDEVILTADASDPEGGLVTYNWVQVGSPTVTMSGATTNTMTFTAPDVTETTTLNFTVTATDEDSESASSSVSVIVNQGNQLPEVEPIPNQSVVETDVVTLVANATDPDGDNLSYQWIQDGTPAVIMTGETSATMTFPAPDVSATTELNFSVTVSDGNGGEVVESVVVTISDGPENQAPTVSLGSDITTSSESAVAITPVVDDENVETVTYDWTETSTHNINFTVDAVGTLSFDAPLVEVETNITFQLVITDEENLTGTDSITVMVLPPAGEAPDWANKNITAVADDLSQITPIVPDNVAVGALEGQAGVSGGSATYSIPIALPPGRAGMQPNVSLSYSSKGGNGIAGVGWSLGVGSSISRCGRIADIDGVSMSVTYSATDDRLCLDGKRLIVTSGVYGESGSVYRTEMDSFVKVEQAGDINDSFTEFTVYHKNGKISYYGTESDGKHSVAGKSEIMSWAINKEEDQSGNNIIYQYSTYGEGEHLLDSILYTGSSSQDGDRKVNFNYQNGVRSDVRVSYLAGGKREQTKLLDSITTEYNGSTIRTYKLDYVAGESATSERAILESVQECGYDSFGIETCLAKTTFDTYTPTLGWNAEETTVAPGSVTAAIGEIAEGDQVRFKDLNGDGVAEALHLIRIEDSFGLFSFNVDIYQLDAGQYSLVHQSTNEALSIQIYGGIEGDINGDGIVDFISKSSTNSNLEYYQFDANFNLTTVDTNFSLSTNYDKINASSGIQLTDINGDGYQDILFTKLGISGDNHIAYYLNKANGNIDFDAPQTLLVLEDNVNYGEQSASPMDVNGDGLLDFILVYATGESTLEVSIVFTEIAANGDLQVVEKTATQLGLPTNHKFNQFTWADINGDGLKDFVRAVETQTDVFDWVVRLNQGDQTFGTETSMQSNLGIHKQDIRISPALISQRVQSTWSGLEVVDIDGDGADELIVPTTSSDLSCVVAVGELINTPSVNVEIRSCNDDIHNIRHKNKGNGARYYEADWNQYDFRRFNWSMIDFKVSDIGTVYPTRTIDDVAYAPITNLGLINGNRISSLGFYDFDNDGSLDIFYRTLNHYKANHDVPIENDYLNITGDKAAFSLSFKGANPGNNYYTKTNSAVDAVKQIDTLYKVEDGLGKVARWDYAPISKPDLIDGKELYSVPPNRENWYIDQDPKREHFYFTSSMPVVTSFYESDGIGGENETSYRYKEAIYNRMGRGFQGFRTIIVDNPVGIRSVSDFSQIFPFAGKIDEARTCLTTGDELCSTGVISKTTATYFDKTTANSDVHWVVPASQVATSYDLVTGTILSQKTTTIDELDVDAYGNILESESIVDSGKSKGFSEVKSVTVNNYTNDANDWWFKLDDSTVTVETITGSALHDALLDPKKEIKTTYTYTANRQPDVVTVEPKLGGGFTTSVDTDYNAYGLPTKVTTSSQGESRSVNTRYSNDGETESTDGYFVYKVTNDLNHSVTTKTYPEHGQVKEVIDANGLSSSTEYDAFGRIEKVTPPLGTGQPAYSRFADCLGGCDEVLSIIEGDFASNVAYKVTTTAAGSPETTLYKDKFNRVLVAKTQGFDGSPIFVRTEYDGLGRKVFESVPSFVVDEDKGTHWVRFDEQGRLLEKKLDEPTRLGTAQWFTTTYAYNDHQTSIDAVGTTKTLPTMYRTYNGIGQLMKTTDAKGGVTEYAYDAQGNPIVLQDANGNPITAKYNALGQKEYVIDPNMGRKDFTYEPFGEIDTETDALSVVTEYDYDTLGRLTSRTAGGVLEASFVYDSASQGGTADMCVGAIQSEVRNDSGADNFNKVYSYDNYCRPSSVTTNIGSDSYTQATQYDSFYGRIKGSQTVTGITLETQYNEFGYATRSLNAASGYVYQEVTDMDARLNLTAALKANGILNEVLAYTHETGQMESVHTDTNVGGSQRHRIDYEYDDFGNLALQKVENIRNGSVILSSESYDYDDLHRLINSSQDIDGAISNIGYVYDAVGNILSKGDFGNGFVYGDISRATDNAGPNAVVSVNKNTGGTATYEYDLNGNMTNGDGKTLTYNAFNKPLTISKGGITSTFSYAADQMRYKQVKTGIPGGTETTIYIDKAYEEITQNGVIKKRSYLGDAIVTETIGGSDAGFKIGFVHRDRLGSTVTITNENGDVVDNKSFDPFGKPREGTFERVDSDTIVVPATLEFIRQLNNYEEHTDRGFTDHEHLDDSELIHMNGRVYDYNLGRFLSVDPFIQEPGNSQSMNPYSYVLNNPLAMVDPSGYQNECAEDNSACDKKETKPDEKPSSPVHKSGRGFARNGKTTSGTIELKNGKKVNFEATDGKVHIEGGEDIETAKIERIEVDNTSFVVMTITGSTSLKTGPVENTKADDYATGKVNAFGKYEGKEKQEIEQAISFAKTKLENAIKTLRSGGEEAVDIMKAEYGLVTGTVSQEAIDLVLKRSEIVLKIINKLTVNHFSKISGKKYAGLFAQVNPSDKYHRIELGGNFWRGNLREQASTILHEASHFHDKALAGTNDKPNALPGVRFSRDARHSFNSAYRFEDFVIP